MATAFDTFDQYAFGQYDGQVADRSMADIISLVATGGAIGYGLAVRQTGQETAALPTGSETSHGITVRESVRGTNQSADNPTPEYEEDETMSVLRVGRVWVSTVDGAAVGDSVYVVPATGELTNTDDTGTNIQLSNAAWKSAAAAGGRALVQLNGAE